MASIRDLRDLCVAACTARCHRGEEMVGDQVGEKDILAARNGGATAFEDVAGTLGAGWPEFDTERAIGQRRQVHGDAAVAADERADRCDTAARESAQRGDKDVSSNPTPPARRVASPYPVSPE
jgi:hypothetical protein